MSLRSARIVSSLVVGMLLSSCSAATDITGYEPLVGAEPTAVMLQTTTGIPVAGLPRLTISSTAAEVNVVWEVESGACLIVQATASRAGSILEIRLHRSGNPLALCVASMIGYRYSLRVPELGQGRYEVRFVETFGEQPPVEIGRQSVVVGAVYVVD